MIKHTLFLSLVLLFLFSCERRAEPLNPITEDCRNFSAGIFKIGESHAAGSYKNFDGYSIFIRERGVDSINGGWIHEKLKKSFQFVVIDDICHEREMMIMSSIILSLHDTIHLQYSRLGLSRAFPTADYGILDADSGIEEYELVESNENWLVIDYINFDTTIVSGHFQASFITTYEPYLTGERERWDDPDRPDTLHFTNGEFTAEYRSF